MISNQILQNTIDGLKEITRIDLSVMDLNGRILATTEEHLVDKHKSSVVDFVDSQEESQLVQGYKYFKVYDDHAPEYVIAVRAEAEDVYKIGKIAAFQIQNLLIAYKERYDKANFIKNLLLDNLLLVDVYNRAKKLHIEIDVKRVAIIIETKARNDINVLEVVRSILPSKTKDFITAVDEKNIVLIYEMKDNETIVDVKKSSNDIVEMLNSETLNVAFLAIGTVVKDIKEVSKSYEDAKIALEVGKIFLEDKHMVAYDNLGIGRLIYQLPFPLCKIFIKEIFNDKSPDNFDEETLRSINKFFENRLNISETARQLHIHRNTLVYRLDKIQKITGLDLRVFEDAITFNIALMVGKYIKYKIESDYYKLV